MSNTFSQPVLEVLKSSGWYVGRNTDISSILAVMNEDGYPLIPLALSFMREFAGLTIHFINKKNDQLDDITIDPIKAMDIEVVEKLNEDFVPRTNSKELCLIGTAYREHFSLMMNERGQVF